MCVKVSDCSLSYCNINTSLLIAQITFMINVLKRVGIRFQAYRVQIFVLRLRIFQYMVHIGGQKGFRKKVANYELSITL